MHSGQVDWLILLMFALFLIVIGFQGNLGTTVGIIFCPKYVQIDQEF